MTQLVGRDASMKSVNGGAASKPSILERYRGALLGLAVGDAIGTTDEFRPRDSSSPLTEMVGGGRLNPGQWTDATSMALCLATSLIESVGFNARDQMNRYCRWLQDGYMSSTGECFDIGNTVRAALQEYLETGDPFAGNEDPRTAGNGALKRMAPIPMFFAVSEADTWHFASEGTKTTHGAAEALQCSQLFSLQIRAALLGKSREQILRTLPLEGLNSKVQQLATGSYRKKLRDEIGGSGYCVDALEAALWAFANSSTFEDAVLLAANLGDDGDSTAAICGQLSGAYYGVQAIPAAWRDKLTMHLEILEMAEQLFELAGGHR